MPKAHQAWVNRSTQTYLEWAQETTSQEIYTVVLRILTSRLYPQLAYRSCDGIKALCRKHGIQSVARACAVALELDQCSYGFLNRHLRSHDQAYSVDTEPHASMPKHSNIRGAEYYN
jgi:hypothetical protein